MTLQQIQCFLAAAETGSLREAANRLYFSQTTLSYQIRALESELRVPLFMRSPNGVKLTPQGEFLLPELKSAYHKIVHAIEKVRESSNTSSFLALALCCNISYGKIGSLIDRLSALYPNYKIQLLAYSDERPMDPIWEEKADVALAYQADVEENQQYSFCPLFDTSVFYLVSRSHPLASRSQVSMKDIAYEPHFHLENPGHFRAYYSVLEQLKDINPNLVLQPPLKHKDSLQYISDGKATYLSFSFNASRLQEASGFAILPVTDAPRPTVGLAYRKLCEDNIIHDCLRIARQVFSRKE